MALDDFLETEVAIAVATTAAVFSPRVRGVLRRGAVLGLAGALAASDALGTFARGMTRGVQQTATGQSGEARRPAQKVQQTPPASGGGTV